MTDNTNSTAQQNKIFTIVEKRGTNKESKITFIVKGEEVEMVYGSGKREVDSQGQVWEAVRSTHPIEIARTMYRNYIELGFEAF